MTVPRSIVRLPRQSLLATVQRRLASNDSDVDKLDAEGSTAAEASSLSEVEVSPETTEATISANQEEHSTAGDAVSSVGEEAASQTSDAAKSLADSVTESAESAKDSISAAATGALFGQRGERQGGSSTQERRGDDLASPRKPGVDRPLYIGNLYFDVTEDDLRRELEKYGTVKSVKIIYDGRGLSKGCDLFLRL